LGKNILRDQRRNLVIGKSSGIDLRKKKLLGYRHRRSKRNTTISDGRFSRRAIRKWEESGSMKRHR
jgi:hypothetical protein